MQHITLTREIVSRCLIEVDNVTAVLALDGNLALGVGLNDHVRSDETMGGIVINEGELCPVGGVVNGRLDNVVHNRAERVGLVDGKLTENVAVKSNVLEF